MPNLICAECGVVESQDGRDVCFGCKIGSLTFGSVKMESSTEHEIVSANKGRDIVRAEPMADRRESAQEPVLTISEDTKRMIHATHGR
jgi:predicted  nucleic acid-binding Zn-ribbon protein